MASTYYPHRNGDYVYEVIVSTDESVPLLRRYRAHPSNVEHIDHGQLAAVLVDIQDGTAQLSQRPCGRSMRHSTGGVKRRWGNLVPSVALMPPFGLHARCRTCSALISAAPTGRWATVRRTSAFAG